MNLKDKIRDRKARIGVIGLNHGYQLALSAKACATVELAARITLGWRWNALWN